MFDKYLSLLGCPGDKTPESKLILGKLELLKSQINIL